MLQFKLKFKWYESCLTQTMPYAEKIHHKSDTVIAMLFQTFSLKKIFLIIQIMF